MAGDNEEFPPRSLVRALAPICRLMGCTVFWERTVMQELVLQLVRVAGHQTCRSGVHRRGRDGPSPTNRWSGLPQLEQSGSRSIWQNPGTD